MTVAWSLAVVPLAKAGEAGKAGPIGLAVILLLCIVSYFLFKSMSKHMRNVRENFPADAEAPRRPEPHGPDERPSVEDAQRPGPSDRPGSTDS